MTFGSARLLKRGAGQMVASPGGSPRLAMGLVKDPETCALHISTPSSGLHFQKYFPKSLDSSNRGAPSNLP